MNCMSERGLGGVVFTPSGRHEIAKAGLEAVTPAEEAVKPAKRAVNPASASAKPAARTQKPAGP
jgi:hypothetical protein